MSPEEEPRLYLNWTAIFKTLHASRLFVLLLAGLSGGLALLASFVMPSEYEAVTTLVPMKHGDQTTSLSSFAPALDQLGIRVSTFGDPSLISPHVVRSRRLLTSILHTPVQTHGTPNATTTLLEHLRPTGSGPRRVELALRKLTRMIAVNQDRRSNLLTIRVVARNPQDAAWIANSVADRLQRILIDMASRYAGSNRAFIEDRLQDVSMDLMRAEERLRSFRERNLRIGNSPQLLLEQERHVRALREQEEVYIALRRQHELAKLDEARDVPTVAVLDTADTPVTPRTPGRTILTLTAAMIGLLMGCAIALYRQFRIQLNSALPAR